MPEGHQQLFKEFLQPGALLPVVIIKRFRLFQALVEMVNQLTIQTFVLPKQADLMLVTEAAVIKIGRANHKVFSVGKKYFGMQILR